MRDSISIVYCVCIRETILIGALAPGGSTRGETIPHPIFLNKKIGLMFTVLSLGVLL
jgi:hypothetical protein